METKKINEFKVKPIKGSGKPEDPRPIKGEQLFPEIYANIGIFAKKKSGKTIVIANIIKECAGRDTHVIAFVSTIDKDQTWMNIKEYLARKNIAFTGYTSVWDTETNPKKKLNRISSFLQILNEEAAEKDTGDEEEEQSGGGSMFPTASDDIMSKYFGTGGSGSRTDSAEEKKIAPPKPTKYRAPEYILVFDDLSDETRCPEITTLLKKNRHYKTKIIISTQYVKDLPPAGLKQLDYWILFKDQTDEQLEKILKDSNMREDFETFKKIYNVATKDKYNFLYIDTNNMQYRKNFNVECVPPPQALTHSVRSS